MTLTQGSQQHRAQGSSDMSIESPYGIILVALRDVVRILESVSAGSSR